MKIDLKKICTFGVAGNFTGHLEQAGEALSFENVMTKSENEPKAIFPTYFPEKSDIIPSFLNVFPFSDSKINYPQSDIEQKLQIESECAILFDVDWQGDCIKSLKALAFGASNDCSIRKEGKCKISVKKNWGEETKGFSSNAIKIDSFNETSLISDYRIKSFLLRKGNLFEYGEDSSIKSYSYFYKKLLDWLVEKFNSQKDFESQENLLEYLKSIGKPEQFLISVGATRYTDFGMNNFLQKGDNAIVCLYPESKYSPARVKELVLANALSSSPLPQDLSLLNQKIV